MTIFTYTSGVPMNQGGRNRRIPPCPRQPAKFLPDRYLITSLHLYFASLLFENSLESHAVHPTRSHVFISLQTAPPLTPILRYSYKCPGVAWGSRFPTCQP